MKNSIETILQSLESCQKFECENCSYEHHKLLCQKFLFNDCVEMLNLLQMSLEAARKEQRRLIATIGVYEKVLDCFKQDDAEND